MTSIEVQMVRFVTWLQRASTTCYRGLEFMERLPVSTDAVHCCEPICSMAFALHTVVTPNTNQQPSPNYIERSQQKQRQKMLLFRQGSVGRDTIHEWKVCLISQWESDHPQLIFIISSYSVSLQLAVLASFTFSLLFPPAVSLSHVHPGMPFFSATPLLF